MAYFFVAAVGILAGLLAGVVGTGSSILLLPILVISFGPKEAVPIMATAAVLGNISRVVAWRNEVDLRAYFGYVLLAVPGTYLGARTFVILKPEIVDLGLGMFFLLLIPLREVLRRKNHKITFWQLSLIGGCIGFLTGVVLSTGPISIPAFAAYGLLKGSLLATEALASLTLFTTKIATFQQAGLLPWPTLLKGALVGAAIVVGTFIGKFFVVKLSDRMHRFLIDALMLVSGTVLLVSGLKHLGITA